MCPENDLQLTVSFNAGVYKCWAQGHTWDWILELGARFFFYPQNEHASFHLEFQHASQIFFGKFVHPWVHKF